MYICKTGNLLQRSSVFVFLLIYRVCTNVRLVILATSVCIYVFAVVEGMYTYKTGHFVNECLCVMYVFFIVYVHMEDLIFWHQPFVFMFGLVLRIYRHVRLVILAMILCVYVCVGFIFLCCIYFLLHVIYFCVVFSLLFVFRSILICVVLKLIHSLQQLLLIYILHIFGQTRSYCFSWSWLLGLIHFLVILLSLFQNHVSVCVCVCGNQYPGANSVTKL